MIMRGSKLRVAGIMRRSIFPEEKELRDTQWVAGETDRAQWNSASSPLERGRGHEDSP